jgi:transglutaminase-like putative cysteine protease
VVYRYGWIAGAASVAFALWRLGRLLEPSASRPRWQLVVLAALVMGIVITLAAVRYGMKTRWIVVINLFLFLVAAAEYGAPDTGLWIFPGPETLTTIWAEIERAAGLIRNGVEPVQPITGLVIVLAALLWVLGGLLAYGLLKERPFVALVPPLVVGLQLLTIERQPSSSAEIAVFVLLVAATALAVAIDEHDRGAGRMARPGHIPSPRRGAPLSGTAFALVIVTVVAAVGASSALASRVPTSGVMTWRTPGSLVAGLYGSVSYDPFVEMHRGLVSQTGTPLFTADMVGNVPPDDVYYRLVTLDTYADGKWYASEGALVPADEQRWENDGYAYAGDTEPVSAAITIHALRQDFLPVPYAVRGVGGVDADSFRIRTSDASVHFAGDQTYNGMEYEIAADVPLTDSGAVATNTSGGLSPLFMAAAEQEAGVPVADPDTVHRVLPDTADYLRLPDGIDSRIEVKARELTSRLQTDFEKGLALEYWFRETGGFVYSLDVDIDEGHGPDVLANFLFDTESSGYRTGYCEQFATSMGVMARSLGIPTRVVLGFLPGEVGNDGRVTVTDISGHAWVELWIPSQGWMRFDPTPRSDGLNPNAAYRSLGDQLGFDIAEYFEQLPETPANLPSPGEFRGPGDVPAPDPAGIPLLGVGVDGGGELSLPLTVLVVLGALAAVALGAIPALKWSRRRTRLGRLSRGDVGAAWEEIVAQLADLDRPVNPAATPNEVAADVDGSLGPLAAVYAKSVYGPTEALSAGELDAASRSMTMTSTRLVEDLSPRDRVRATYRLASVIGAGRLSRWLPWLRP